MIFFSSISVLKEPQFFHQAISQAYWREAAKTETEALQQNNTWSLASLPTGKHIIRCKWIYKIKYKADGEIEHHKSRLVAKRYTQQEGIDFYESFSPVANLVTVHWLLAVAIAKGWNLSIGLQ